MQKAHLEAQEAAEAVSFDTEDKIERAKEMIKKANLLLFKAKPVRLEEIARLEQLRAQNYEVLQHEMAKRATLAEIEARLSQMANFNEAELRLQAFIRAAEERKSSLATLEEWIKF